MRLSHADTDSKQPVSSLKAANEPHDSLTYGYWDRYSRIVGSTTLHEIRPNHQHFSPITGIHAFLQHSHQPLASTSPLNHLTTFSDFSSLAEEPLPIRFLTLNLAANDWKSTFPAF